MKQTRDICFSERVSKLFYYCLVFCLAGILLRYTFKLLLPFIIGFLVSSLIVPIAAKISKFFHVPKRLASLILLFLLLGLLAQGIYLITDRLIFEAGRLLMGFESDGELRGYFDKITEVLEEKLSKLPFIKEGEINGREFLLGIINKVLSAVYSDLSGLSGSILSVTPYIILVPVVTVMSCFYFTFDYDKITGFIDRVCKCRWGNRYPTLKSKIKKAVKCYIRAYVLLFCLTFFEVLLGLWILKIPYALILSICIAFVDIFPVLGAGTVLLPWGCIMLAAGNHHIGIGLIILYGIITIVRQIAEPHILGESLGIHPLLSLIFMFLGFGLFGVFGMLAGPFAATLVSELLKGYENSLYGEATVNADNLPRNE